MQLIAHRGHPAPNLGMIPRRGRDELLQLLMIHPEPLGHRLHRLALAVQHQPAHVQLTLGPLIRPRQPTEHLRGERLQPRPDPSISSGVTPTQDHARSRISRSDTPNKVLLVR